MPRNERIQALLERKPLEEDDIEGDRQKARLKKFLDKINSDEKYPIETIEKLIYEQIK